MSGLEQSCPLPGTTPRLQKAIKRASRTSCVSPQVQGVSVRPHGPGICPNSFNSTQCGLVEDGGGRTRYLSE